jgi:glucose/arabinose dehydrogenase
MTSPIPSLSRRRTAALGLSALLGCCSITACAAASPPPIETRKATVRVETVASGLQNPWGLAFLPDGRALVTERPGRLRIVATDGRLSAPLTGVPAVDATGQGGLLDVALDPDFARNGQIYLSFAEPRGDGLNGTSVARAKLDGERLTDVTVIFRQQPAMGGGHHFGSRLVFDRSGYLFVTLGDRNRGRDLVQKTDTDIGKIVRIDRDGRPAPGNPFLGREGVRPEIWSLGHRNVQGAALHPQTGELWTNEHGPRGGDELNRTLGGRNYGWPLVTYGVEYSGLKISDRAEAPGFESPVHHWTPSIGTSGLAFYTADRIAGWRGSVFVGGLASRDLARLELEDGRVVAEERLFKQELGKRIRAVVQGPDGALYLLTDESKGEILRVVCAG